MCQFFPNPRLLTPSSTSCIRRQLFFAGHINHTAERARICFCPVDTTRGYWHLKSTLFILKALFSYASSSALQPGGPISHSVRVLDQRSFEACELVRWCAMIAIWCSFSCSLLYFLPIIFSICSLLSGSLWIEGWLCRSKDWWSVFLRQTSEPKKTG